MFILSGRVSGERKAKQWLYCTKLRLRRYPAPALLPCNLTRLSALLSGAFLSSALRNSIALPAGFPLSLLSLVWELFLRREHPSPAAAPRSPLPGKSQQGTSPSPSPGTRDPISPQKHLNVTSSEKVAYWSKMRGVLNLLGVSQMQIQWWKEKGSIKTRGLTIRL